MHIAASAIDHGAAQAFFVGEESQDVAPYGRIFAAAIVDYNNSAGAQLVDEVTDSTGFFRIKRSIEDRIGTARKPEILIPWLDAKALSCNS